MSVHIPTKPQDKNRHYHQAYKQMRPEVTFVPVALPPTPTSTPALIFHWVKQGSRQSLPQRLRQPSRLESALPGCLWLWPSSRETESPCPGVKTGQAFPTRSVERGLAFSSCFFWLPDMTSAGPTSRVSSGFGGNTAGQEWDSKPLFTGHPFHTTVLYSTIS